MKKIVGLLVAAVLILGMVAAGTWAYFSDTETSTATLTAGSLDLEVNDSDVTVTTLTVGNSNIVPGDSGNGITQLTAVGIDGVLSLASSTPVNTEGTPIEIMPADGTPGELGAAVTMAMYIDVDDSDDFSDGDIGLMNDGTTYVFGTGLQFASVNSYGGKTWSALGTLVVGSPQNFSVEWQFVDSLSDQNACQGDAVSIDFTFTLNQVPLTP
jgi:spore coat-associated protein N